MKHIVTINRTTKHTVKPTNISLESINCKEQLEVTIKEFSQLVTQPNGFTWCPATFNGTRANKNWLQQSMFALDFDSGISISDVVSKLYSVGLNPNIVYTSFSDTPVLRKFRVVLFVDRIIDNATEAKLMQLKLMNLFDSSVDIACKDYARMFFGGKELVMISEELNNVKNIEQLECKDSMKIKVNNEIYTNNENINLGVNNQSNGQFEQVEIEDLSILEQSNLFRRFKKGEWLYHNELFVLATNLYWLTCKGQSLLYKMKTTMNYWNEQGKTQYTENNFNIINSQLLNKYSPASLKQLDKSELYTNLLVLVKNQDKIKELDNKLKNVQNKQSESNSDSTLVLDKKEGVSTRVALKGLKF